MRRVLLIVGLTSALALPVAVAPATAGAAPNSVKKLQKAVKTQGQSIGVLSTKLTNLTTTLGTIQGAVATLTTGGAQLQSAVSNPTTGLPGLNAARPQFGAFLASGNIIAGTGQSPPASGPSGNAAHPSAGTYIVHFGNDVSKRFLVVTLFPTGAAPLIGSAANCSSPGNPCTAGDTNGSDVLVLWQATNGAPTDPANGFEVAALSG